MPVIDGTWGRYRHQWTRGQYIPGLPGVEGRPPETIPNLRNMFEFDAMPVRILSSTGIARNVLADIHMNPFLDHPDFNVLDSTDDLWADIFHALMRGIYALVGIDEGHPIWTTPYFDPSNFPYLNTRVDAWLEDFRYNGTSIDSNIGSLFDLLNDWVLFDENDVTAATVRAQYELIAAITGAELPMEWAHPPTWGDYPRPPIPGQWIYDRNTILDPRQPLFFQVGPNSMNGFQRHIEDMSVHSLGLQFLRNRELDEHSGVMLYNRGMFISARYLSRVDDAISYTVTQLASMGATISRLTHADSVAESTYQAHANADMNITSADMAREMMRFTRAAFRRNMGNYVLSQTNQHRNMVTQLIGGANQPSGVFSRSGMAGNPIPASTMSWDG